MRLAAIALALSFALACRSEAPSPAETDARPAPARREPARELALERAAELERVAAALAREVRARRRDAAIANCIVTRRAWRRIEPLARLLAPVAASQIDPEADEPDEIPRRTGLRVLADALASEPPDWALALDAATLMENSAKLAKRELATASWDARRQTTALSRAIFEWGRRLDGSRAESDAELSVDVLDGGRSLLDWSALLGPEVKAAGGDLSRWIDRHGARPADKLAALAASGRLGAAVRGAAIRLGTRAPAPPFLPLRRTRAREWEEPVHVATFPALLGAPPRPDRIRLGAALFFDGRLSKNGKMSCASCHRVESALAAGTRRPLSMSGGPVPRDVPSLWNTAYEPMHFWDGRASTLADQVRIAVEHDMGGDWRAIVARLSEDEEVVADFRRAYRDGLVAENVRDALGAFERTLIDDSTPFDRYVRGDTSALDAEQLRGFDVYFGKSRCSRCHRLPLTSGTIPPRFTRAEASAIGVPTSARSRKLDPDRGRGAAVKDAAMEHAFKVPSLRNLDRTAPYFHNGSFRTLEEVVDFYEKGSGPALGIQLDSFDPDARAFELTDEERRALIAFLREGLKSAN